MGLFISCSEGRREAVVAADLIIFNGSIYTMDERRPSVEAVVLKADTVVFAGERAAAFHYRASSTSLLDLKGRTLVPGLIEGHAHILGVGYNLLNVDLRAARSYEEVVEMVAERAKVTPRGQWILGRGWHQDKWDRQPEKTIRGFPTHDLLSERVPNHPVWLKHASGHAALGNQKAMRLARVGRATPQPDGGEIIMGLDRQPTGVFNETAQALVDGVVPGHTKESDARALGLAIAECLRNGIVGFHQAGAGRESIQLFSDFAAAHELKLRLYVMLDGSDSVLLQDYFARGIQKNLYEARLTIRAVKLYADGALGSRGAWLLEEYADAPGVYGHKMSMSTIERVSAQAYQAGFQVCTHAIGDRANREVLDIYEKTFELYSGGNRGEPRFRIEHAQHIHPDDISRFGRMGVIPSMQAIHLSSDRPWAIYRLGRRRTEGGAYRWQDLLQSGARIVNGSDAPVEPVNPLAGFYALVSRKTLAGNPEGGYEPSQKMTREQALRAYTIDAAYSAFLEEETGSIEVGKWADFTVLDRDIMVISEKEILTTRVMMTIIGGEVVYEN